jgi:hypothetical protein
MQELVFTKTHLIVQSTKFLFVSIDEVTTIDCQGWIVVHMYVVEGWKHIHVLLTLKQVLFGAIANNITKVIVGNLLQYGGLFKTNSVSKLISFGANGVLVLQGVKTNVVTQLKKTHTPFMLGVHCFAHKTNLVVQMFSKLLLMSKIEALLQYVYNYYCTSLKSVLDICKLAKVIVHLNVSRTNVK